MPHAAHAPIATSSGGSREQRRQLGERLDDRKGCCRDLGSPRLPVEILYLVGGMTPTAAVGSTTEGYP
jgi:hypothetical protein